MVVSKIQYIVFVGMIDASRGLPQSLSLRWQNVNELFNGVQGHSGVYH